MFVRPLTALDSENRQALRDDIRALNHDAAQFNSEEDDSSSHDVHEEEQVNVVITGLHLLDEGYHAGAAVEDGDDSSHSYDDYCRDSVLRGMMPQHCRQQQGNASGEDSSDDSSSDESSCTADSVELMRAALAKKQHHVVIVSNKQSRGLLLKQHSNMSLLPPGSVTPPPMSMMVGTGSRAA